MTEAEYNQAEGIRRSDLWRMHESPEKFKWFLEHPPEQTPALLFGTAVHKLLLEPDGFKDDFAVAPVVDRRTKVGKEAWEQFLSDSNGKTIITADDFSTASDMVIKAMTIPFVRKLLSGKKEEAFFWIDEDTEQVCKVRIDMLTEIEGKWAIADYKTAGSAKTDIFVRKMYDYGYHLQSFMYTEAVKLNLKLDYRPDFYFIVQEKHAPYSVNYIKVTDDVILTGMDSFREFMGMLRLCRETGYWYGYNGPFDEANEAYVPGYISPEEEEVT